MVLVDRRLPEAHLLVDRSVSTVLEDSGWALRFFKAPSDGQVVAVVDFLPM